ncbi:PepSY domain-containing protein [Legionella sp. CNM-1927-20]|uniref:PepSY domain-containing protein n=1 Tax=Legionella sp. CNM-1927-20 TaxID=3422221 RepID=UPI00403B111A
MMLIIKNIIKVAAVTSGIFLTAQVSAAENPTNSEADMRLSTILKKLTDEGYTNIQDVEIEDGVLSVEGTNKEGVQFELHLNPKTGKFIKKKEMAQPKVSIIDVVKKFENDNKLSIIEIEFDEGIYKVKAMTSDKKEKEFQVDPKTGETKSED